MIKEDRRPAILVVDDEFDVAIVIQRQLKSVTNKVVVAESGEEAIEACRLQSFDLVLSDMRMPEMHGVELLQRLAHDYPMMRRMVLTGYLDIEETISAINLGKVHRYLIKPIGGRELISAVSEELRLVARARSEITRLRTAIDQLI